MARPRTRRRIPNAPGRGAPATPAPLGRPGGAAALGGGRAVQCALSEPRGPWSLCRCRTSCAPWTPPPSRVCCGSARVSTSRVSEGPRPLRPRPRGGPVLPARALETRDTAPWVRIPSLPLPKLCDLGPRSNFVGSRLLLAWNAGSLIAPQGGDGKSMSSDTQVGGTEPSWGGTALRIA